MLQCSQIWLVTESRNYVKSRNLWEKIEKIVKIIVTCFLSIIRGEMMRKTLHWVILPLKYDTVCRHWSSLKTFKLFLPLDRYSTCYEDAGLYFFASYKAQLHKMLLCQSTVGQEPQTILFVFIRNHARSVSWLIYQVAIRAWNNFVWFGSIVCLLALRW